LQYQIDSYNPIKKIGLEVEAGRSKLGNALYRDIIQTALLVGVDYFVVAVPQKYRYLSSGKQFEESIYLICKSILDAIYGTTRFPLPFRNTVLISY